MKWLFRVVVIIAGNALALWLADRYIPGFVLSANLSQLAAIALVFSLMNVLLKPILKLLFGPIIILTLGLGTILVNVALLWLLPIVANYIDFLHGSIMITSIPALIYGTLVVSAVNIIVHNVTASSN